MRLWTAALLLLAAMVGGALAQASGGRDPAGYKIPPFVIYCMRSDGRVEACGGPTMPLAVQTLPAADPAAGLQIGRVWSQTGSAAVVIKNSPGRLYSYNLCNTSNTSRYVRLYDSKTPVTGTTPIEAGPVVVSAGSCQQFSTALGLSFGSGISLSVTSGPGETDTGAVGEGDISGFLGYL